MKQQGAIFLGLVLGFGTLQPARSVPVVPNFTQGSMTSRTETTSTVNETINSMDYNTGWQYSVTGTNVQHSGESMSPGTGYEPQRIDGVTSRWTNLNVETKPNWTIVNQGESFQFTETYSGPGLSNQTIIQRETTIQSATDTVSIFQQ